MSSSRSQRVKELFQQAAELPAAGRERFLRQACGADGALRREVEELLRWEAEAPPDFLSGAPDPLAGEDRRIGPYRLLEKIGEGGMGTVYLAEQEHPRRRVALKVVRPGMVSKELVSRFRYEAEVLGQLAHPGIARIFDAGAVPVRTADGEVVERPFFAMELVEGQRLDEYARSRRLGVRERLELVARVCDAVQHAHGKGVVHRDLKPDNVLVVDEDGEDPGPGRGVSGVGRPKVLDFGVARATDADVQAATVHTRTGQLIGTLAYMSPEQVEGDSRRLDHRSDVYALGAILYELVTGRPPHDVRGVSVAEAARRIRDELPIRPSALDRKLQGDVETILLRALEKDRDRRYASAADLGLDLRRFLRGEPIDAKRDSTLYVLGTLVRRHPALATAATVLLVVLAAFAFVSSVQARENRRLVVAAEAERAKVLRLSDARRLEDLVGRARALWPPRPELEGAATAWLRDAEALRQRLETFHYAALEELRGRAAGEAAGEPRFASAEDAWQHDVLARLVADLEAFLEPDHGLVADVARRLEFARRVEALTVSGPEVRELWEGAVLEITDPDVSPHYAGVRLEPVVGLVPIGPDPRSGLWEFAQLQSGAIPRRDPATDELLLDEDSGIVLVLLPGGEFWMGEQRVDDESPNFYPEAGVSSGPAHLATVAPFLLSKYEMTQAQWLRLEGENPSRFGAGRLFDDYEHSLLHPVESVSWHEAADAVRKLGLRLPTEAEWEYAARAGTTTPWWTGPDRESLRGAANLADRAAARAQADWLTIDDWPGYEDGYATHAPVDRFPPNPFGLHATLANVREWCANAYYAYDPGGELYDYEEARGHRALRGGSFMRTAAMARAGNRSFEPMQGNEEIGLRPALGLAPR